MVSEEEKKRQREILMKQAQDKVKDQILSLDEQKKLEQEKLR